MAEKYMAIKLTYSPSTAIYRFNIAINNVWKLIDHVEICINEVWHLVPIIEMTKNEIWLDVPLV